MKHIEHCGCFPTGKHYPGIAHLIKVQAVGVVEEFDAEQPWVDYPVAMLDTETTGTDSASDHIIEVGIVIGQHGQVQERYNWLVNPGVPIPAAATEVHGIKDEDLVDKPSFSELASEIVERLSGAIPAAYNAAFDRGFLHSAIERSGFTVAQAPPALRSKVAWIDPLVFAREIFKGRGESRALGAVAERLGVEMTRAHRASDDALAALEVLYALAKNERVPKTYGALVQEQRRLERQQEAARRFWR